MKSHVTQGLQILEQSEWLKDAGEVVGSPHEKLNGDGYLNGLSGGSIPFTARIFSIADVFDALCSRRPYKEPFTFEETMKIIRENTGNHFDSVLIDIFCTIARSLYEDYAGREDDVIKIEVDRIIQKYFLGNNNIILD
ncbi:metal dependent phosphohydrolase [Candidatus Scalindua japonica]|uniref:Metal dependent phosphohydrolase n=2 Tax=Candidatus Scalindua japonica TaxID=1284222 RepID=A0A286U1D4_9BACT|nr:metal dependent phosphohydrolase [Candidatus Scalindua japonica]